MLVKHSQTAQSMGIPAENMVVIDNGDVVELSATSIKIGGKVPSGIELVDASRSGVVNDQVLKERQQLAEDGIVTVATVVNWKGELIAQPEIHLRGVVTSLDKSQIQEKIDTTIAMVLHDRWSEFARSFGDGVDVDWTGLQVQIERELVRLLRRELQSNPLLVFLMQHSEVGMERAAVKSPRKAEAIAS
jgi:ribonuclease J